MALASLAILVPLTAAPLVGALRPVLGRTASETVAVAVALAVAVLTALLLAGPGSDLGVHWLSGWEPVRGMPVGIALTPGRLGAGVALFASTLTVVALLASWRLREAGDPLFHVVVLVLLGAMVAFCESGDLFTLFVFFELMSVCAYALVGLRGGERAPLQGALNFAITNSIGSIALLIGVALVYGRTGALNLARIGDVLGRHGSPDALVVVAFALIVGGFLVRGAVVPFHFWLADAYAAATAPVCLLLAGAFTELGLFGVARVYWTGFAPAFGAHAAALRWVLVVMGLITALTGAAMALDQCHLRRMLAFVTISSLGLYLVALGLLEPDGLGGAALWAVAAGCGKAALFVGVGVLEERFETVDAAQLHGRGRDMPLAAGAFGLVGLAVAGVPPFGPFWAKALAEHGAEHLHGFGWVPWAITVPAALAGAAVLRTAAGVFGGIGSPPGRDPSSEDAGAAREPEDAGRRNDVLLGALLVVLTLATLVLGALGGVRDAVLAGASGFTDDPAYRANVLHGDPLRVSSAVAPHPSGLEWGLGAAGALVAVLVALASLLPVARRSRAAPAPARGAFAIVRAAHSGRVGDYVLWVAIGLVLLGGTLLSVLTG